MPNAGKRVLVCGGRGFGNVEAVVSTLDAVAREFPINLIIQGGASGVDKLACYYAEKAGVPILTFKVDWSKWGKAAGPIRNQAMIDRGKPDLVIAFPGNSGTADMVARAKRADIEVREIVV